MMMMINTKECSTSL